MEAENLNEAESPALQQDGVMRRFLIRVTKAGSQQYWYANKIGMEYEVEQDERYIDSWHVVTDYGGYVMKDDAVVLKTFA